MICWLVGVAGVRRVCGVHGWQNGTRCRDGVKVLWCYSYLVWLVFEGSIPTCACFQLKTFFVTLATGSNMHAGCSLGMRLGTTIQHYNLHFKLKMEFFMQAGELFTDV